METAFLAMVKANAEVMKRQQNTIDRLQETLDRIVTAKYDRPVMSAPQRHVPEQMPDFMLSDQGDGEGPRLDVAAALTTEKDSDFLEMVGAS
jgi:hypothetical protein